MKNYNVLWIRHWENVLNSATLSELLFFLFTLCWLLSFVVVQLIHESLDVDEDPNPSNDASYHIFQGGILLELPFYIQIQHALLLLQEAKIFCKEVSL